jgi:geranylgeranyl reductase family protein
MSVVSASQYDVLVVGAGPAGSVAALVLARGGARVALVDKASFPRDKACGDLIGPRGVQVLEDLGIDVGGQPVGDMEVVGPTGRRVRLRAFPGLTYPGFGLAVPRREFDAILHQAALDGGADGFTGRADQPLFDADGRLVGFRLAGGDADGVEIKGGAIIGADGALSRVGQVAGLVQEDGVLWGFAIRAYVRDRPPLPQILFWEPTPRLGYPGYGWLFPGAAGMANLGIGVGVRGDRRGGTRPARDLDRFVSDLLRQGYLTSSAGPATGNRLGGWLKMGMVGTTPARGRILLVGDAAGLVNPLQGEGISQALGSARSAASALLGSDGTGPARRYLDDLKRAYAGYAATTASVTAAMLAHPRLVAATSRVLTAPGLGRLLAGGWAVYWNDLLDGSAPGWPRRTAAAADRIGTLATQKSASRRALGLSLHPAEAPSNDAQSNPGVRTPTPRH